MGARRRALTLVGCALLSIAPGGALARGARSLPDGVADGTAALARRLGGALRALAAGAGLPHLATAAAHGPGGPASPASPPGPPAEAPPHALAAPAAPRPGPPADADERPRTRAGRAWWVWTAAIAGVAAAAGAVWLSDRGDDTQRFEVRWP